MTECPKCHEPLEDMELDLFGEVESLREQPNAGRYDCPKCGAALRVFIKVDTIEIMSEGEAEE